MPIKRVPKIEIMLVFIFFCTSLLGCRKELFDYRNKFIGNYSFTIHVRTVYGIGPYFVSDTTYISDGKVEIGSDKNCVLISSSSFSIQATLYEDGTLEGYWDNNGKGEFSSTKEMKYSWGVYSPGGSATSNILGEKK